MSASGESRVKRDSQAAAYGWGAPACGGLHPHERARIDLDAVTPVYAPAVSAGVVFPLPACLTASAGFGAAPQGLSIT